MMKEQALADEKSRYLFRMKSSKFGNGRSVSPTKLVLRKPVASRQSASAVSYTERDNPAGQSDAV